MGLPAECETVMSFLFGDLKDFARFGYYSGWWRHKMARAVACGKAATSVL
jgi:hypothetical protein